MTIGQKIKLARLNKFMTQSELSGSKITRNMLSAIESGRANPSMDTVRYLANKLELPLSYLLSDNDDLTFYLKKELITEIKAALSAKKYKDCIALIDKISELDDELAYILVICHFEIGAAAMKFGSLATAKKHLLKAKALCSQTIYDTSRYEATLPLYTAIVDNINAPLLEFDISEYDPVARIGFDYEFYKYLVCDDTFPYSNKHFKIHLNAKAKIKAHRYSEAIELLKEIIDNKNLYTYNVYMMLSVYTDIDHCYKQLRDFESAHKYSTKKITLLENLNT